MWDNLSTQSKLKQPMVGQGLGLGECICVKNSDLVPQHSIENKLYPKTKIR